MTQIQVRRGTAAAAAANNEILAAGEFGCETDTGRVKVGNGVTTWNNLQYLPADWASIIGKPAVIAAGETQAVARSAIGAGTSSLTIGTTGSTAKAGNYTPTYAEVVASLGFTPENAAGKNQPNGYAGVGSDGFIPSAVLPSYVDDVVEYANLAAFPATGTSGKIYTALDTSKIFRWSGSTYVEISPSPGSTDAVPEGATNLYYTDVRAQAANASAINAKEPTITAGTTSQYWRGDKSWQTLDKTAVGLSNVDNTADLSKPVSTATQTAIDGKQSILTATSVKTSAYTAAANELIPVDASGGSVTVTLPNSPASGTRFVVKKIDSSTNAVTLACQGSDRFNTASGLTTRVLSLQNEAAQLQYNATLSVWYVISTDLPLSQADLRYQVVTAKNVANGYAGLNGSGQLTASTTGNAATATKLATARNINGVLFDGTADINPVNAATVGPAYFTPGYVSNNYYLASSVTASSTSNALGNGAVRVNPWIVTAPITVIRLFAEFTVAGDAASVYRIGIWNHDPATGKPSSLVLDAGTISTGGTPGVYEITVSQALSAGVYYLGGAVQGVTTTQPTMRINQTSVVPQYYPLGTSLPGAGLTVASWTLTAQTGAFGSLASAITGSTPAVRIGFRVQ